MTDRQRGRQLYKTQQQQQSQQNESVQSGSQQQQQNIQRVPLGYTSTIPTITTTPSQIHSRQQQQQQIYQTLPRHFDYASMQQSNIQQQRMPIPEFPNPHSSSATTTPQVPRLPFQYDQSSFLPSPQQYQQQQRQNESEIEKTLRRKQHFSNNNVTQTIPPPTPPLARGSGGGGTASNNLRYRAPPSPLNQEVEKSNEADDEDEEEEESEEEIDSHTRKLGPKEDDLRWSSDESTPTPTASSVAAASIRRRQEAKTMVKVNLLAPNQVSVSTGGVQQSIHPSSSAAATAATSAMAITPAPPILPLNVQSKMMQQQQPQQPASQSQQKRPISASSVTLSSGHQVPTIRKDFENMKKITRPLSSSNNTGVGSSQPTSPTTKTKQSSYSQKQSTSSDEKGKRRKIDDDDETKQKIQPQPQPQLKSILLNDGSSSKKSALEAALEAHEPHQMTPVQEEDDELEETVMIKKRSSEAMKIMQGLTGQIQAQPQEDSNKIIRSRRQSSSGNSLRRSSFESGTTALDTPQIFDDEDGNGGRTSFEMMRRENSGGGGVETGTGTGHITSKALQNHRAIVQGLVDPPSDVLEVQEPVTNNSETRGETPKSHGISSHLEQLNKFINNNSSNTGQQQPVKTTIKDDQNTMINATKNVSPRRMRNVSGNSGNYSNVIPILATGAAAAAAGNQNRPRTGGSNRPGTGQTRFSIDHKQIANLRRSMGSGNSRTRGFGGIAFGGVGDDNGTHQHNKPACKQCFRAGFDCAIQLHSGQGTGARKALQEFVIAGGLDALSGVEDFYEGSIWGSQAIGPSSRQNLHPNVKGQNFVDKLGEVAFGESALSRPVTRGAVQDMLEERGRILAEQQQNTKTVEQFLLELQRLQKEQEDENGLEEEEIPDQIVEDRFTVKSVENQQPIPSPQIGKKRPEDAINNGPIPITPLTVNENHSEQDQESIFSSASEKDDLPFLADRWPLHQKIHQITIYSIWIFCIECLSSGYLTSLPYIQKDIPNSPSFSLEFGQFTFLIAQGFGLWFGSLFSTCFGGKFKIPFFVVLFSIAICVVIGFMHSAYVIIALRGVLGYLSGIYQITFLGMLLDLSSNSKQRFGFLVFVSIWFLAAQSAGPWIAKLILGLANWSWLYWLNSIAGLVYLCFLAFLTRETEPLAIYRKSIENLQRETSKGGLEKQVWTPEPKSLPNWKEIVFVRSFRPLTILFTQPIVILAILLLAFPLGSFVAIIAPLINVLQINHHFSSWKSSLFISICIAIGLIISSIVILLFGIRSNRFSFGGNSKQNRTRILFMDEKGIIDAQRPFFSPEKNFLFCSIIGLIILTVGLYTLALTENLQNWFFSGISLVFCVSGITFLIIGSILYISESFYPSTFTKLGEVLALSDTSIGPAPQFANISGMSIREEEDGQTQGRTLRDEEMEQDQEEEDDDHTLMSGANQDGKRWDSNWALNVLGSMLGVSLIFCSIGSFVGQLASFKIGFNLFVAILASIVLGISGLSLLLLIRFGHTFRRISFNHIAKSEQNQWYSKRNSGSDANISVTNSTGTIRSIRSPQRVGTMMTNEGDDAAFAFNQTPRFLPQISKPITAKWKTGLKQFLLPTIRASSEIGDGPYDRATKPPSIDMDPTKRTNIRNWIGRQKRLGDQQEQQERQEQPTIKGISNPFNVQHISSGLKMMEENDHQNMLNAFGVQIDYFPSSTTEEEQRRRRRSTLVNEDMASYDMIMKQHQQYQQYQQQQQIMKSPPPPPTIRKQSKEIKQRSTSIPYQRAQTPPPM